MGEWESSPKWKTLIKFITESPEYPTEDRTLKIELLLANSDSLSSFDWATSESEQIEGNIDPLGANVIDEW